jgi:hypothetical protein
MGKKIPRCEGYRRYGGAWTLGPVKWQQCTATATVMLTIKQDGKKQKLPACPKCWQEARGWKGIIVLDAEPIVAAARKRRLWVR